MIILLLFIIISAYALAGDFFYESIDVDITQFDDGTIEKVVTKTIIITADKVVYSDTVIVNTDYQEYRIEDFSVIQPNTERPKPWSLMGSVREKQFTWWNGNYKSISRMFVISDTLEKGMTFLLQYKITSKPEYLDGFAEKLIVGKPDSIAKFTVKINIPSQSRLSINLTKKYQKLKKTLMHDNEIYEWEFKGLPAIPYEPMQPEPEEFVPTLYISSISKEVANRFLNNNEFFELNDVIKSKVDSITMGIISDFEKAYKIREFLLNRIQFEEISPLLFAFKPQNAEETYELMSGSELDLLVICAAMCRHAGVKAYPVLGAISNSASKDFNNFAQFDKPAILISNDEAMNRWFIFTPDVNQPVRLPNDFLAKPMLVYGGGEDYSVELLPSRKIDYLETKSIINIKENDSIDASIQILARGAYAGSIVDYISDDLFDNKLYISGYDCELSDQLLLIEDMSAKPMQFDCSYTNNSHIKNKNLNLPEFFTSFSKPLELKESSIRKTPVRLLWFINEKHEYKISFLDSFKPEIKIESDSIENNIGIAKVSVTKTANDVSIKKQLRIFNDQIEPERFPEFVNLLNLYFSVKDSIKFKE